jgi:hypothetical protein
MTKIFFPLHLKHSSFCPSADVKSMPNDSVHVCLFNFIPQTSKKARLNIDPCRFPRLQEVVVSVASAILMVAHVESTLNIPIA